MTEMRVCAAVVCRPIQLIARHIVVRAAHGLRLKWGRREEGSAVCLLVVRSGMATTRPALTLGLVGVTLLACSASLIGMTYLNRDPILSVRKTLALTAARSIAQNEPSEVYAKPALPVPEWVVEHFSPNVPESGLGGDSGC